MQNQTIKTLNIDPLKISTKLTLSEVHEALMPFEKAYIAHPDDGDLVIITITEKSENTWHLINSFINDFTLRKDLESRISPDIKKTVQQIINSAINTL